MGISAAQEISVIRSQVSRAKLKEITGQVLRAGQDKDCEAHDFYRFACTAIKNPGFRKGHHSIPLPVLTNQVIQVVNRHDVPFDRLMWSFLKLEADNYNKIRDLMAKMVPELLEAKPETVEEYEDSIAEVTKLVKEQLDLGLDSQMLSLLAALSIVAPRLDGEDGVAVGGDNKRTQDEEKRSSAFHALLTQLEKLDPADPFWEQLDSFFSAIEALKASKQASLAHIERLGSSLRLLQEEHGQRLESYFKRSISDWSADAVGVDLARQILEELDSFKNALGEHLEAEQTVPGTAADRKKLNAKLEELEDRIYHHYDSLSESLANGQRGVLPAEPMEQTLETSAKPDEGGLKEQDQTKNGEIGQTEQEGENVSDKDTKQHVKIAPPKAPQPKTPSAKRSKKASPKPQATAGAVKVAAAPSGHVEEAVDILWRMIAGKDLAGAYWLARGREAGGDSDTIPSWLLAAMEGSRYLLFPNVNVSRSFSRYVSNYLHSGDSFTELSAIGVGLIGALLEPAGDSAGWLLEQKRLPRLERIQQIIREFTYNQIPLGQNELLAISDRDQREKLIRDAAAHCGTVVKLSRERRFALPRVNRIWKEILGDQKELYVTLEKVMADQRDAVVTIMEDLGKWRTNSDVVEKLEQIDLRVLRRRDHALQGYEKERLIRALDEVLSAADRWVNLVQNSDADKDNWKHKRVNQLTRVLKKQIPLCFPELEQYGQKADLKERLAAEFIGENLKLLFDYVSSNGQIEPFHFPLHLQQTGDLEQILAGRLFWLPELELLDTGLPTAQDLQRLAGIAWEIKKDWLIPTESLYMKWEEKQDYRFLEQIALGVQGCEEQRQNLSARSKKLLQGSRDALKEQMHLVASNVERALVNGVISEEQRVDLASQIESIDEPTALNITAEFRKLEKIKRNLEEETERRLAHQRDIWLGLSQRLGEIASDEDGQRFRELVETALNDRATRVVDEYIAKVRAHLERNELFVLTESEEQSRNYLAEFSQFRLAVNRGKNKAFSDAEVAAKNGRTWVTNHYANIPERQLEQALTAFRSWRQLNTRRGKPGQNLLQLFTFLGFSFRGELPEIKYPREQTRSLLVTLPMEASDQARPFPHFGSMAQMLFHVLLVWERPGAHNIVTEINDARLSSGSTIMLYFGRISETMRRQLTRITRKNDMRLIVLDEALFLYLTGQRDARLKALLRCAVPYGTCIPYTPEIMGKVPPEVFYGRRDAIRELQRRDGSCLVYGGRQMGKSALLRYVQRRSHNPERNQYAWVEEIDNLGDEYSQQKPGDIWPRLWRLFFEEGFLQGQMPPGEEKIIEAIGRLMRTQADLQVLLMLDEADSFLNSDAAQAFKTVRQLRGLMNESERRFKVVFAGLQHVQRFQGLPNQPLAHFGRPILVGPLESADAMALVREPLEALGFELDDACVYSILSFTNYHPGLIQIFCYQLLRRLYKKYKELPAEFKPLKITKEDVEIIYLQDDVRDKIKERFEWTLALDERYQVITWAMIVEQTQTRDSFSQHFSVGELAGLANDYWPAEFIKMTDDEFRGLLRELEGLGVLSHSEGKYRLKSPNLVRLMGTEADIQNRLESFILRPAAVDVKPDSFHELIGDEQYSIFTYAQARSFDEGDFRIVTISKALGYDRAEQSIKALYADSGSARAKRINLAADNADKLESLIRKERDRTRKRAADHLILYQLNDQPKALSLELLRAAHEFSKQGKKGGVALSFYFVMSPRVYWEFLRQDPDFAVDLNAAGAVVKVKKWNKHGIGQRLDHLFLLGHEDVKQAIVDVSGGWPFLIDEIINRTAKTREPQPAVQEVQKFMQTSPEFRDMFLRQLELPEYSAVEAVVQLLLAEGGIVPHELILPEFLKAPSPVSKNECALTVDFLQQFGLVEMGNNEVMIDRVLQGILQS